MLSKFYLALLVPVVPDRKKSDAAASEQSEPELYTARTPS
jgi:hypothetical protein